MGELRAAFDKMDVDNTGILSRQNLEQLFGGDNGSLTKAQLDEIEKKIGRDGPITRSKFMAYLAEESFALEAAAKVVDREVGKKAKTFGGCSRQGAHEAAKPLTLAKKNTSLEPLPESFGIPATPSQKSGSPHHGIDEDNGKPKPGVAATWGPR